jgi:hypothetical protein
MAYNKEKDVSAGYISPMHQDLLQSIIETHKRTKRGELEWLIEQAVINEWGYEHYRALIEAHQASAALPGVGQGGAQGSSQSAVDASAQGHEAITGDEEAR